MLKRIAIKLSIFLLLIIAVLIGTSYLLNDFIVSHITQHLNTRFPKAHFSFQSADVSFWRAFPNLQLSFDNLVVMGNQPPFAQDTLAQVAYTAVGLGWSALWKTETTLTKLQLESPFVNLHVLPDGAANWQHILSVPNTPATVAPPLYIAWQKYSLSNANLLYRNQQTDQTITIKNLSHKGKGDFRKPLFLLDTQTDIDKIYLYTNNVTYLHDAQIHAQQQFLADKKSHQLTVQKGDMQLNQLPLTWSGYVDMPSIDSLYTDLKFTANITELKQLLSILSGFSEQAKFDKVKANGQSTFQGQLQGAYSRLHTPLLTLRTTITNGVFQYENRPPIESINADLSIKTMLSPANSNWQYELPTLQFSINNQPFAISGSWQKQLQNTNFMLTAKGILDLAALAQRYPFDRWKNMSGTLTADISGGGNLPDSTSVATTLPLSMQGSIQATQLQLIPTNPHDLSLDCAKMDVQLVGDQAQVELSQAVLDQQYFQHIKGTLTPYLPYLLNPKGKIGGNLTLQAQKIDVPNWLKHRAAQSSTLANVADIRFTLQTDTLQLTEKLTLQKANAQIGIQPNNLYIESLKAEALGGQISLKGSYSLPDTAQNPQIKLQYQLQQVQIEQAYAALDALQQFSPLLQYVQGKTSAQVQFRANLNEAWQPQWQTAVGKAEISLNGKIANAPLFNTIADATQLSALRNFELKQTQIQLALADGKVQLRPITLSPAGVQLQMEGSHGLDQSIDYKATTRISRKTFGNQANEIIADLLQQAKSKGVKLNVPEFVTLYFTLSGTVEKPEIHAQTDSLSISQFKAIWQNSTSLFDSIAHRVQDESQIQAAQWQQTATQTLQKAQQALTQKADTLKKQIQVQTNRQAEQLKAIDDSTKKDIEQQLWDKMKNNLKDWWYNR